MLALLIFCVAIASLNSLGVTGASHTTFYRNHPYIIENPRTFLVEKFWTDLNPEFLQNDVLLRNLRRYFPSPFLSEGVDGGKYKVTLKIEDIDEKDIVVKAREGFLAIQAIRKDKSDQRNDVDIRSMPDDVDLNGSWSYSNDVLTVVFPLKGSSAVEDPGSQTSATTYPVDLKNEYQLMPMRF